VVLKQIYPDRPDLNPGAMVSIENALNRFGDRIIDLCSAAAKKRKGNNVIGQDTRVRFSKVDLVYTIRESLAGELAHHAINEGDKAVTKLNVGNADDLVGIDDILFPIPTTHNEYAKFERLKSSCGLQFPVVSVLNKYGNVLDNYDCAVYITSLLEYLGAEILEIAGQQTSKSNENIHRKHVLAAVLSDEELYNTFNSIL